MQAGIHIQMYVERERQSEILLFCAFVLGMCVWSVLDVSPAALHVGHHVPRLGR